MEPSERCSPSAQGSNRSLDAQREEIPSPLLGNDVGKEVAGRARIVATIAGARAMVCGEETRSRGRDIIATDPRCNILVDAAAAAAAAVATMLATIVLIVDRQTPRTILVV